MTTVGRASDDAGKKPVSAARDGAAVLFDIDDTLVDLAGAMGRTLREIPDPPLAHLDDDAWVRYTALYTADPQQHYDRFLAGEVTFQEQRVHRIRHARSAFTKEPFTGEVVDAWVRVYEETLPRHFATYDDVAPLLDELDARGVPYGAVSNNTRAYQRAKLDRAGLQRVEILVGIDTVGVAKPAPEIYLEGVRLLDTEPHRTVYVGDNRAVDAVGSRDAGLIGVWLNRSTSSGEDSHRDANDDHREGEGDEADGGVPTISTLHAVLQFLPPVR